MSDNRDERIAVYVSETTKEAVKHEATAADQSMAEWVREQIRRGLKNAQQERTLSETNAESRLQALIAELNDDLNDTMDRYRNLMAATGDYAAANHILLQQIDGITAMHAADARSDASKILQKYPGEHDIQQHHQKQPESDRNHLEPPSSLTDTNDSDDSGGSNDLDDILGDE